MKTSILPLALLILLPSATFAGGRSVGTNVLNPLKYAQEESGGQCEYVQSGYRPAIECLSEEFPGEGIECSENGFCEPTYNVPTRVYCRFSFRKMRKGYRVTEENCEDQDQPPTRLPTKRLVGKTQ